MRGILVGSSDTTCAESRIGMYKRTSTTEIAPTHVRALDFLFTTITLDGATNARTLSGLMRFSVKRVIRYSFYRAPRNRRIL